MRYAKLTLVTVYRMANGGDCSNNGITARYDHVNLLIPEGMPGLRGPIDILGGYREIDLDACPENTLIVKRRVIFGEPYYHAEPIIDKGYMCGGNLIDYCGNGFRTITGYPLRVHDRLE